MTKFIAYFGIALAIGAYSYALLHLDSREAEIASDAGNAALLSASVALLIRIERIVADRQA